MMKSFFRSFIGFGTSAIILNTLWGIITGIFGLKGGWISGFILTGTLWYFNHYKGFVDNNKEAAFIDMGLAVAICSFSRDSFINGIKEVIDSMPTLICVITGGIIAGVLAGIIKRNSN
ncbi:Lin0368 family putative glycerol transporter subunit [uncultured Clostridium sp.]|uniref:Lin0368 family putative glycerol transporter subunit n=1 Tax=uncultured Clostridium sp. TaxID=59620 RepID=UPI0025F2B521|nr:hypothetical protein [uncultured Clostridium sp.]